MKRVSTKTIYLGPGEPLSYYKTPPVTPPDLWRTAVITTGPAPFASQDEQRATVQAWVEQLVRRKLGARLGKAQKRSKAKLAISVDVPTATLITAALRKRAKPRKTKTKK